MYGSMWQKVTLLRSSSCSTQHLTNSTLRGGAYELYAAANTPQRVCISTSLKYVSTSLACSIETFITNKLSSSSADASPDSAPASTALAASSVAPSAAAAPASFSASPLLPAEGAVSPGVSRAVATAAEGGASTGAASAVTSAAPAVGPAPALAATPSSLRSSSEPHFASQGPVSDPFRSSASSSALSGTVDSPTSAGLDAATPSTRPGIGRRRGNPAQPATGPLPAPPR
mmetsp:Transcript_22419/g.72153  ORF Transcript_22419/g.72153 Transcript_22419/m.72153 type:complete len:230 (-) Transcript_22419:824-1513(-)